ncbi:hypothetical protein TSAR_012346 [Trichomalopsis sarcophagae]|uniref:Uncharacterized protein n=1 Tax=Trichomalopsis sarcophagae TaxID=543379 RepID=A0A232EWL1_9HYME|nr:hypothetical protein TSAR_012346 [Trichomalopsis sarcophagae]
MFSRESPCNDGCQKQRNEAQLAAHGPAACLAAPATTSARIAAEAAMQPTPVVPAQAKTPSPTCVCIVNRESPAPCNHGCRQHRCDEAEVAVRGPPACSAAPATNSTGYPLAAEAAMQPMTQATAATRTVTC